MSGCGWTEQKAWGAVVRGLMAERDEKIAFIQYEKNNLRYENSTCFK